MSETHFPEYGHTKQCCTFEEWLSNLESYTGPIPEKFAFELYGHGYSVEQCRDNIRQSRNNWDRKKNEY